MRISILNVDSTTDTRVKRRVGALITLIKLMLRLTVVALADCLKMEVVNDRDEGRPIFKKSSPGVPPSLVGRGRLRMK